MSPSIFSLRPVMRKALRIVLLVFLFMSMAGIGAYVTLTLIIKGEEPVVVPDLVGKDILYGLEVLSDLGLNTRIRGTIYHATVAKNHVVDQEPGPGAFIKRGRDVKVRVSRGPEQIAMPNLTGLSLQQSNVLLTENGLCQGVISTMTAPRYAKGQVISQHPPTGATVSRQECVDLLVSHGPRAGFFPLPDMVGWPAAKAIGRIETLQLKRGRVGNVRTSHVPSEAVVGQTPLSGYRVARGDSVSFLVNRRPGDRLAGHPLSGDQTELFRFYLKSGFLKKRVRVTIEREKTAISIFDDIVAPGQEIWLLVPKGDTSTVRVYIDGRLATDWAGNQSYNALPWQVQWNWINQGEEG